MTRVINIKDAPKDWKSYSRYVYIGREGKGLSGFWGNPFRLEREEDRPEVLKKYIDWFKFMDDHKLFDLSDKLPSLKNKILVCFCAPKLCHGDILALLADLT